MEYFPLTKEEALANGYKWRDEDDSMPDVEKKIPAKQLPEIITDIPDDILNWAIICSESNRPFRIINQELDFYRKWNIPIPYLHPDIRHDSRQKRRTDAKLHSRVCSGCGKDIKAAYASERPEIVYCESCYLSDVY
jgi:hypothetical protein